MSPTEARRPLHRPVMDAGCPQRRGTSGEVVLFSLEQFSERLIVGMKASVLRGHVGRDYSPHYTRGFSWAGCWSLGFQQPD